MRDRTVLVTGASGFVGRTLIPTLTRSGLQVVGTSRSPSSPLPAGAERVIWVPGVDDAMLRLSMRSATSVVHLAARVHVMSEAASDPIAAYRAANVEATLDVARLAHACGVKRFVFVSSVKVFGESGHFREADQPRPTDPYGQSKREAEDRLREFGTRTGMDVVIVRPPLVYGPGVKANFAALVRLVARGLPLPFGAVQNRRSYVAVGNLSDAIRAIIVHPEPIHETFTITDGYDLSTVELIRLMASAMDRKVTLFRVPPSLLLAGATLAGQRAAATRLLSSLTFESGRALQVLGWKPRLTVAEGVARAVSGDTE